MSGDRQSGTTASAVDVLNVKERHQDRLLALPGVCGVAVARDAAGNPILQVHVSGDRPRPSLPSDIEGFAVEVKESGPFRPFALGPPS